MPVLAFSHHIRIEKKNPLKQGLKQGSPRLPVSLIVIEKKNPLKQGLKHTRLPFRLLQYGIEKKNPLKQGLKPRILFGERAPTWIEKKNPLKQGLKPVEYGDFHEEWEYWKEESIKTRIETIMSWLDCIRNQLIEKKNPLKQGLKLHGIALHIKTACQLKRRIH